MSIRVFLFNAFYSERVFKLPVVRQYIYPHVCDIACVLPYSVGSDTDYADCNLLQILANDFCTSALTGEKQAKSSVRMCNFTCAVAV